MKYVVIILALLSVSNANAGTRELYDCSAGNVEKVLTEAARWGGSMIVKVLDTANVKSRDVTEERWCMSHVLWSNGRIGNIVYNLKWTSETDGRFWLQVKG
jgi:hypothetical protein